MESKQPFITQYMRRGKVIGLSVHPSVRLLSPRKSPDLDIQVSEQLVSVTNQLKSAKNWLECASNRLAWSTNVTNSIFLLAIVGTVRRPCPLALEICNAGHAHAHNWSGRGRQHYRYVTRHAWGMCSREIQLLVSHVISIRNSVIQQLHHV